MLSAVTLCPPTQNVRLFKKKIVTLCTPSQNVRLCIDKIVTLRPPPHNIRHFRYTILAASKYRPFKKKFFTLCPPLQNARHSYQKKVTLYPSSWNIRLLLKNITFFNWRYSFFALRYYQIILFKSRFVGWLTHQLFQTKMIRFIRSKTTNYSVNNTESRPSFTVISL